MVMVWFGIAGMSVPSSLIAFGVFRLGDFLYQVGLWPLGAIARIVSVIMQLSIGIGIIVSLAGLAYFSIVSLARLWRPPLAAEDRIGRNSALWKPLLVIVGLSLIADVLIPLFTQWLKFGEIGMGLLHLAYFAQAYALHFGTIIAFVVWLVSLPKALSYRKSFELQSERRHPTLKEEPNSGWTMEQVLKLRSGSFNLESVAQLRRALKSHNGYVRIQAAESLARWQVHPEEAIPVLVAVLETARDPSIRSAPFAGEWLRVAAAAIGGYRSNAVSAVPALVGVLADRDYNVRGYAARSLGQIGSLAASAIPALEAAINQETMLEIREIMQQAAEMIRTS